MSNASVYFTLGNLHGKHDAKKLRRELDALPGVFSVSVSDSSSSIAVDFDTTGVQSDKIRKEIEKMGYEILDSKLDNHVV